MLYVIPMITTKIFLEKTQKEMRRKQKCTTTKKSTKPKARQSRRKSGTEKPCKTQEKKITKCQKLSPPLTVITSYVNILNSQSKDIDWQNGGIKTGSNYMSSVKMPLNLRMHIGCKRKDGKRYPIQIVTESGVTILIS